MCMYLKKLLVNVHFFQFSEEDLEEVRNKIPQVYFQKNSLWIQHQGSLPEQEKFGRNVFFARKWLGVLLDDFWAKTIKVVANGSSGPNQWVLKAPQVLMSVLLKGQHLQEYAQCLFMLTGFHVSQGTKTRKCPGSLGRRKVNEGMNGQVTEVRLAEIEVHTG